MNTARPRCPWRAAFGVALALAAGGCTEAEASAQEQPADDTRAADAQVLASIRRALQADETLSARAKQMKIVVAQGTVTLRGWVADADEKTRVVKLVQDTPGVTIVDDQLDIGAP